MPVVMMQGKQVLTANQTVQNVVQGNRYERCPFAAAVGNLYATSAAIDTVTLELNIGGQSVTPPVNVSGANRIPLVPDDIAVAGWEVTDGKLIQITAVGGAAGGTLWWRIDLEEAQIQIV